MIEFKNPEYFLLFLLYPPLLIYYFRYALRRTSAFKFSSVKLIRQITPSPTLKLRHLVFFTRLAAVALLIFAMSRPQTGRKNTVVRSEGIDIILSLDISSSMRAEDFQPDHRLAVAKNVISSFVKKRVNDRIGLVVYGSESFLQCPLTLDHDVLLNFLKKLDFIPGLENSTAIGTSLATAVNHLKSSETKSKIIILLTDGVNNTGDIDPITGAELASTYDIKVYAVGIGKPGMHQVMASIDTQYGPRKRPMPVEMHEEPLKEIADITGGLYFNAQNVARLRDVYKEIDKLEKTEIKTNQYLEYDEKYSLFVLAALCLVLLELLMRNTIFRTLP